MSKRAHRIPPSKRILLDLVAGEMVGMVEATVVWHDIDHHSNLVGCHLRWFGKLFTFRAAIGPAGLLRRLIAGLVQEFLRMGGCGVRRTVPRVDPVV